MRRSVPLVASLCLVVPTAFAQWSTPTLMPNVSSTASEWDASPTFDGLTLYLSSTVTGNWEILRATRTAPYGTFGAPTVVTELADPSTDVGICTRFDDLEIFFTSFRAGGLGMSDIWRADRPSKSVPFNPPVPVTELNTPVADAYVSLTFDGLTIYFSSTRPGGLGGNDIWTATRPNWSSPFGTPTPVTELNTTGTEFTQRVSPDGLTMLWANSRAGGLGNLDIWMASRLDLSSPFGNFINLTALNSPLQDNSPAFAVFHDEVFFLSFRPGGLGSSDFYTARFTGLLGNGIAGAASTQALRFSDPSSPAAVYLAASALGSSPGIPIDTRTLPLNADVLLRLSIGGLPPILTGYVGALDQDGIASGGISFANFAQFIGLKFFTAFVVLDPAAPSAIKTISNAHEVLVQ